MTDDMPEEIWIEKSPYKHTYVDGHCDKQNADDVRYIRAPAAAAPDVEALMKEVAEHIGYYPVASRHVIEYLASTGRLAKPATQEGVLGAKYPMETIEAFISCSWKNDNHDAVVHAKLMAALDEIRSRLHAHGHLRTGGE